MRGDAFERRAPGFGERLDLGFGEQPLRPDPVRVQDGPVRCLPDEDVDLQRVGDGHVRLGADAEGVLSGRRGPVRAVASAEPAEEVEEDARFGQLGERRALGVQVAQHAVADAVARERPQPLLDALERLPRRGSARERARDVHSGERQPHRVFGGEPADGPAEVGVDSAEFLLASVSFDPYDHVLPPGPGGDRQPEPGQQHLVRAGAEDPADGPEQLPAQFRGQLQVQRAGRAQGVPRRVRLPGAERGRRVEHLPPQGQFLAQPLGRSAERARPLPQRRPHGLQPDFSPVSGLLPCLPEVGQQDPPRHPVDREVVDDERQPAVSGAGVSPDGLDHHSGRGIEPAGRRVEFGVAVGARLHPAQHRGRVDASGGPYLQLPRSGVEGEVPGARRHFAGDLGGALPVLQPPPG